MPKNKEAALITVSLDKFYQSKPGVLVAEASMLRWPAGRWPRLFVLDGLPDGPQMALYKHFIDNGLVHVYKTLNYELHVIND